MDVLLLHGPYPLNPIIFNELEYIQFVCISALPKDSFFNSKCDLDYYRHKMRAEI
jgi:hypothetical protein